MNSGSKLRRRDFLRLSAVTASGATLAAAGAQTRVEYFRVFWLPRGGDVRAA